MLPLSPESDGSPAPGGGEEPIGIEDPGQLPHAIQSQLNDPLKGGPPVEVAATADSNSIASSPMPQHLQALERANRVRLARAALKRSIASGEVPVTKVITECPWQTESMTLSELLRAQSRWGRTRTRKLLASVGLNETKRLDTLTERQRMLLVSQLRPH